jgi:hypothetical protein
MTTSASSLLTSSSRRATVSCSPIENGSALAIAQPVSETTSNSPRNWRWEISSEA